jgi:hypothetical protein
MKEIQLSWLAGGASSIWRIGVASAMMLVLEHR